MEKKPHIILINPDQWRGDVLGHMGNPAAHTPFLDEWVTRDAVSVAGAFCQNPVCTPSRCSFMSGWYPHVRGHRTMYHMMQPGEPVLLKTLKDNGYYVWWGGKNDLVPGERGFDAYCHVKHEPERKPKPMFGGDLRRGEPGSDTYYSFYIGRIELAEGEELYYDSDWANVLGAIDLLLNTPEDQPLCLYLPLVYPHPPYAVEEPWHSLIDRTKLPARIPAPADWTGKPCMMKGLYERIGMEGWTEDRWDELRATYYGMCSRVDYQISLIVEALKETGRYEDTALFVFSDHGDFCGDYGLVEKAQNVFTDSLTRVPLIIKPPSSTAVKPRVSPAMAELIDLPATVFELTGIEPGYTHFGRSLLPVVAGETDEHRDVVFCEGGRRLGEIHCNESSMANSQPESLYYPRGCMQRSEDGEHTKAVMIRSRRYKYVRRLYEQDELYDLQEDPGETVNRINDDGLASVLAELKERLLTFFLDTADAVPHERNAR
ncbi:sulfatase-like hydrolase/transferase [Paenibacillus sp. NPDC056579]|uniref:sulfatase-like hydrolase/transferase n=1 Tax=Paenibacillus sp. NPDC056579 TaxID=3345871 RepID=UPI0036BD1106